MSHSMAQSMGLYQHTPQAAPCVQCGRTTTRTAMTAFRWVSTGRFMLEATPQCKVCWCDQVLAKYGPDGDPQKVAAWRRYRRLLARSAQDPPPRCVATRVARITP